MIEFRIALLCDFFTFSAIDSTSIDTTRARDGIHSDYPIRIYLNQDAGDCQLLFHAMQQFNIARENNIFVSHSDSYSLPYINKYTCHGNKN